MATITFTINRTVFTIDSKSAPIDTSLNTFIRNHALLTGTNFMCLEGGCGACVVNVSGHDPVSGNTFSYAVNSCLFPIFACHELDIVTVEGIGGKQVGYHRTQKALAHFNGTQCGYCSPGMVMNMYSLLESKNGQVTMEEIENSFGGNICRCTGYRPILDAFKALASDADPKLKQQLQDIEDLSKVCPKTGKTCSGKCSAADKATQRKGLHLNFEEHREWHKVYNVSDIFVIFEGIGRRPYMLVGGNTAHGVYRRSDELQVFIDINSVEELKMHSLGSNLTIGAGNSLSELMDILTNASKKDNMFSYLSHLVSHIDLIANVPVRNSGSIAGNLSIKNQHKEFPSDLYIILEAANATLTVLGAQGKTKVVKLSEFIAMDITKKILLNVILPPLDPSVYVYRSFKIMPRAQNSHAYVNAAFLFKLDKSHTIESGNVCFGGINPEFTHATKTEAYLKGKNLFTNDTIQGALRVLSDELSPDWVLPDASPEYRKNLALSLFYKSVLSIATCMNVNVKSKFVSGGTKLHRPLSAGMQEFFTNENNWPMTKNVPKVEGLAQSSGEAKYVNDMPSLPRELHAAFVLATVAHATITEIDDTEAMKLPGVVAFYSANAIPGENDFMSMKSEYIPDGEEIFCSQKVLYHGQPVGIVVAESFQLAQTAATKVRISYACEGRAQIHPTVKHVIDADAEERISITGYGFVGGSYGKASAASSGVFKVRGQFELGGQYHYTMETQSCLCVPTEDGLDVYSATQWTDLTQIAISKMLNIPANAINVYVRRLGGGYGGKASRSVQVACACALACYQTKRPVRLVMTLESNMMAIGKRYGAISQYAVDADEHGRIKELLNEYTHDSGCNINEAPDHIRQFYGNCYKTDAWKVVAKTAITDSASNTWCRAPGTTEALAMIENIIEHIAFTVGLDAFEVRLANIAPDSKMRELMLTFRHDVEYEQRKRRIEEFNAQNRWHKRGIAIVPMKHPINYFGTLHALVSIYHADGSVAIVHGGIEMGQGINTKAVQVAAKVLGISTELVSVKPTTNLTAPNAFCTQASITSEALALAVSEACETLLQRMQPIREHHPHDPWPTLVEKCFAAGVDLCATSMYNGANLPPYTVWAVACAEIDLDVLTGNVVLRRVDILEDTGESVNPAIDIGQIEGAFMMGVGYYLTEALIYDPDTGALLTNRTWNYKPPGAKDIPVDFRIRLLQNTIHPTGILRSKATGEPATNLGIVALFAVRNALLSARHDADLPPAWIPLGAPCTPDVISQQTGNSWTQYQLH